MAYDNKQLARRVWDEIWNQGKLEAIEELIDPTFEGHDPLMGPLQRDAFRNAVKGYRAAFPDLKFEINAIIAEDHFVTTRWTVRATHLGPFLGTESSGKSAEVTGISLAELRNGRLVSDYTEWDVASLFRQLGLEDVTVPLAVRRGPQLQQARP